MTAYHIKRLPPEILPDGESVTWSVTGSGLATRLSGGVATWPVADAERWRKARVPAVLAPVVGGWILAALVVAAYVLLFGLSSASGAWGGGTGDGTDWLRYPGVVLLTALPFWYRYVPVAAAAAALYVAVEAGMSLARSGDTDHPATAGHLVVLAACAVAFTGGCLRLWARRRQRALALASAGKRRFPLPDRVPESDGHRGHAQVYLGLALCLVAAGILTDGLVADLTSGGVAYDAVGQQRIGLVLLVAGTTFGGWGQFAYRAARRLYEEEQPALIVGVRAGSDGRHWVCADARTRTARPLVAYLPRKRDTRAMTRLLGSGSAFGEGNGHHDIDPKHEPFEAVLYGTLAEGDEVVLEYACAEYHRHQGMGRMYATVTTAPLRPDRRHGLGPWEPADGAARQRERLREAEEGAERYRRAQREAAERRRNPPLRPRPPGNNGRRDDNRHNGVGCGSSCGSSCGGGCGGD
ncbi:hypothetical protein [Streptomyces sp. ADI98-10]|uniref:hypothetical protein n=1 Tax=Streptomyces sp. ADI98-10 TaxID=1522763 RepID=UPI000F552D16|nr:hypothetical protein [Streptomyces sp. ADI98-10]RPK82203.1 hypothetical protein EES46_27290 [Streptomyces sp. ADI98-10]